MRFYVSSSFADPAGREVITVRGPTKIHGNVFPPVSSITWGIAWLLRQKKEL